MVLFLFVIMLMNLNADTEPKKNRWLKMAGIVAGGCLLLVLVAALKGRQTRFGAASAFQRGNQGAGLDGPSLVAARQQG